jgi:hypothetical protein
MGIFAPVWKAAMHVASSVCSPTRCGDRATKLHALPRLQDVCSRDQKGQLTTLSSERVPTIVTETTCYSSGFGCRERASGLSEPIAPIALRNLNFTVIESGSILPNFTHSLNS